MKAALLVGAIVIGGVATGFALERAGAVSLVTEGSVVAHLDEVPYSTCPDEPALGTLHRGDRVFVTGRTADGAWSEIRAPYHTDSRVWVLSQWLFPDTELVAAAIVIPLCTGDDEPANGVHDSTTTTSLPDDAPTPSSSTSSTTTSTSSTSTSTTSSSTTTSSTTTTTSTTLPADSEGPTINFFQSSEADVWENGVYCGAQQQTTAVSAVVFDPSGVTSVQLSWTVGTSSGSVGMSPIAQDVYSVTIGPFDEDTVSGGNASISLMLTATDAHANEASSTSGTRIPPLLHDCVVN